MKEVAFVKGHGTHNDFVVVPDLDATLDLSPDQVRWLCDRRAGVGADGVLRVVRTEHVAQYAEFAGLAEYFMDYRNADGSVAEMCGNGVRVFARFLDASGMSTSPTTIVATRGGLRSVTFEDDATISVEMGHAVPASGADPPIVRADGRSWAATGVLVPNPHAVVFVDDLADPGDLRVAPHVEPATAFPEGVNVEFVATAGPRHVRLRVFERGVGETMSCGTGACAVAWAARRRSPEPIAGESTWRVDVPGGSLTVTETADGVLHLRGPAELVARGVALVPDGDRTRSAHA